MLSSFTLKLNSAESVYDCVEELRKTSANFFDISWYSFISLQEKFGKEADRQVLEFAVWSLKKHRLSVTPIGDSMVMFVPLFSRNQDIGVLIFGLKSDMNDITRGVTDIESFLAFETSMVIENMFLTKELLKKNEDIAEAKFYLENVLNSLKYAVVVEDIYRNEEFSNIPYQKLVEENPDLKEQLREMINMSFADRTEISNEMEIGKAFYSVHVVPVKLSSGLKVVVSIQNITNTKELERLQKINRMKNDFVASISHELKTPLSAILAYSETILDSIEDLDVDTLRQFIGTIKNEGEHLQSIVSDMLEFSKLESDSFPMNFKRVDLLKILRESYEGSMAKALEGNIKFELSIPDDLEEAYITADSKRIREAIDNLVVNAFKYNDSPSPEVKIILYDEKDNYVVEVYDNGSPIPDEEKNHIFQKFYRIETMKANASGTGLGLALVKEIVEKHHAKIWVEDNNGCSFKISFPKKDWLNS
ncbi:sensor histidine kinase [Mesoaciditoga lauensis]|uniref:sensor histidine kinase n=1 Tax=Mesoaciditoga lauensis TaxID=1495039 RepID=UPI0009DECE99|nr:HAMP domain-containing sensor histidine kinase [Mesoaciditoga lauensis]